MHLSILRPTCRKLSQLILSPPTPTPTPTHTHTHTPTASSFRPTLLPTSVGVELSAIFPALLPTSFSLVTTTETLVTSSESQSSFFKHTYSGLLHLSRYDAACFVVLVRIAVKVGGIEGDASSSSNTISTYMLCISTF